MFLNIQIDSIILKTDGQQFILTTKMSLHDTFTCFDTVGWMTGRTSGP